MSILFPTLFTWTEEDFLLVTGKIASLFIMTSTAGSIASPAALGYLIEEVSPMWYAYILLGESIGVTFFFAIAALLKKRLPQLQDQRQREITTVDLVSSVTESNPEQSVLINNRDNNKSL
jgi:MFS family permease